MSRILVDSSFLIALFRKDDLNHYFAIENRDVLNNSCYVTNLVISEVLTVLAMKTKDMELVYQTDNVQRQDAAGNQIANFGLTNGGQREFVAVLEKTTKGQPLPGMILAGLLSLGTVAAGKKMRKRS